MHLPDRAYCYDAPWTCTAPITIVRGACSLPSFITRGFTAGYEYYAPSGLKPNTINLVSFNLMTLRA